MRHKSKKKEAKLKKSKDFTEITLLFLVPNEKFEQFASILSQLYGLLNDPVECKPELVDWRDGCEKRNTNT